MTLRGEEYKMIKIGKKSGKIGKNQEKSGKKWRSLRYNFVTRPRAQLVLLLEGDKALLDDRQNRRAFFTFGYFLAGNMFLG